MPLYALCDLLIREAEVYRSAFQKEKELTDRALKLAETGKPKSNWELQRLVWSSSPTMMGSMRRKNPRVSWQSAQNQRLCCNGIREFRIARLRYPILRILM